MICAWMDTSQRRDRLIADDELGIKGQGTGNGDTLALSAGELVRIPAYMVGLQTDGLQQGGHLLVPLLGSADVVDLHGLPDDLTHRHTGVQGGVGVLEDHLHISSEVLHLAAA